MLKKLVLSWRLAFGNLLLAAGLMAIFALTTGAVDCPSAYSCASTGGCIGGNCCCRYYGHCDDGTYRNLRFCCPNTSHGCFDPQCYCL
jgi:hypothetical protein